MRGGDKPECLQLTTKLLSSPSPPFLFEAGPDAAQNGLELPVWPRLALNFWILLRLFVSLMVGQRLMPSCLSPNPHVQCSVRHWHGEVCTENTGFPQRIPGFPTDWACPQTPLRLGSAADLGNEWLFFSLPNSSSTLWELAKAKNHKNY